MKLPNQNMNGSTEYFHQLIKRETAKTIRVIIVSAGGVSCFKQRHLADYRNSIIVEATNKSFRIMITFFPLPYYFCDCNTYLFTQIIISLFRKLLIKVFLCIVRRKNTFKRYPLLSIFLLCQKLINTQATYLPLSKLFLRFV